MAAKRNIKLKGNENILIVRHDHLGDLVLSLPIANVLKQIYPDLTVDFLTSKYNDVIIPYAEYVDRSITADYTDGTEIEIGELAAKIARNNYQIAIFARPDLRVTFAAWMAGIPIRIGTSRRAYSPLFNNRLDIPRRRSTLHEVDLNLKLLEPFGINVANDKVYPILKVKRGNALKSVNVNEPYIVIHPGSKGSAANWPPEYYRQLINELSNSVKIMITGQTPLGIDHDVNVVDLINKTDFAGLMEVIDGCSLLISNGTGPLHIASALGRPTLGLFPDHPVLGPRRWAPRGDAAVAIAPDKQTGHKCSINIDGSCECMRRIKVETVKQAALDMLKATENMT